MRSIRVVCSPYYNIGINGIGWLHAHVRCHGDLNLTVYMHQLYMCTYIVHPYIHMYMYTRLLCGKTCRKVSRK